MITSLQEDNQYLVTFDGYGNQEIVGLGDMMLPAAPKREQGDSRLVPEHLGKALVAAAWMTDYLLPSYAVSLFAICLW